MNAAPVAAAAPSYGQGLPRGRTPHQVCDRLPAIGDRETLAGLYLPEQLRKFGLCFIRSDFDFHGFFLRENC